MMKRQKRDRLDRARAKGYQAGIAGRSKEGCPYQCIDARGYWLSGPDLTDWLHQMYGNQPDRWSDDLQGPARWRVIVNALTRLRFCTAEGVMEFATKDSAADAPAGYLPWFDVPGRRCAGTPVAFGHWSTLGPLQRADLLALDTGCVWGGQLSAACLPHAPVADARQVEIIRIPCPQAQAPGRGM